jgi:hypothetical protein
MCPVSISVTTMVSKNCFNFGSMGINGKLELVCAHKYGYYEQVMTQLACSEEKGATLIIWTKLGFIDLPIQFDEQYWYKSMRTIDLVFSNFVITINSCARS